MKISCIQIFFISIILIILNNIYGDITVEYNSSLSPETIKTSNISSIEYFNVFELNKTFKANISDDLLDQRLNVNIYGEQLIFLLDSSLLQYGSDYFNMTHEIIQQEGKYFLPVAFLTNILPQIFNNWISWEADKLKAKAPIDNSIKRIVLDPGHGGKDPGAVGFSKKNFEKEIVLELALKLKKKLEQQLDVEVLLSRDKDEFVSLQQRTKFANENNADLFISLHCNAHRKSEIDGIEVYYLSTAKTDEARAVEAMENQVVYEYEGGQEAVKKYDDLAFILADMAQSEHLEESYNLGANLQSSLVSATEAYDRGVKQANFYVLRGAFMPSVLLEFGFISNKEEEKKLINSSYQEKLIDSVFIGIRDFKMKYDQMQ
ncbi:MAG: N-acetylmuramoyl-L-alanine amidase [Candidatus Cloacimonetes bacterium]|nr:N-acetylmuramoyl-L-alanine amidase [Candidatus Cloacimonadota bacterium]